MSDNEITLVQPERTPLPVTESWEHELAEVRAVPSVPGGYFDFVQQYATATQAKPFMLTRPVSGLGDEVTAVPPPPPLPEAKVSAAPPPPPPPGPAPVPAFPEPKVSAAPPPPPPPEPRPRAQRTTDLPPPFTSSAPVEAHPPLRPLVAAYDAPVRKLPSTLPPPVAIDSRFTSAPPPASGRAWSVFTVGPLSALVAALVSSLVWSFHTSDLQPASDGFGEKSAAIQPAAVPPCTTTRSGEPGSAPSETPSDVDAASTAESGTLAKAMQAPEGVTPLVSVDALPMVGKSGAVTKAALVTTPSEPAPRLRASRARAVQARQSDADEPRSSGESAPAAAPSLPKGPDRAAVAKAMARAASASASCGSSPNDGRVSVSLAPSGVVSSVSLLKGFGDAEVNACVLRAFSRAKIPAYDGEPTQVRKGVRW